MLLVQVLVDNPASWIIPFARNLVDQLKKLGHKSVLLHEHEEVKEGDILCLLSCEKIFKKLSLNCHNLVVHESALPKGKGWSPLTWQILEGRNDIPITLFEATEKVDDGPIYFQETLRFEGHELLHELREAQGKATIELILKFINQYPNVIGSPQVGNPSFYPKRTPKDSQLDIKKSIEEQFNLLRVCDNERYPAHFFLNGNKYTVNISKENQ